MEEEEEKEEEDEEEKEKEEDAETRVSHIAKQKHLRHTLSPAFEVVHRMVIIPAREMK